MLEDVKTSQHSVEANLDRASRLYDDAYDQARQEQGSTSTAEQSTVQLAQYYQTTPLQQWVLQQLEGAGSRYPGYPPQAGRDSAEAVCEARHMSSNECYDFKHLSPREQYEYDRLQSNEDREDYLRDRR